MPRCLHCGRQFRQWRESQRFCSVRCHGADRHDRWVQTDDGPETKRCDQCGAVCVRKPATAAWRWVAQRFCSCRCAGVQHRGRKAVIRTCGSCGETFSRESEGSRQREFCSRRCASKAQRKPDSQRARRAMGLPRQVRNEAVRQRERANYARKKSRACRRCPGCGAEFIGRTCAKYCDRCRPNAEARVRVASQRCLRAAIRADPQAFATAKARRNAALFARRVRALPNLEREMRAALLQLRNRTMLRGIIFGDELVPASEAARRLGVPAWTVLRMAYRQQLPALFGCDAGAVYAVSR